MTIRLPQSDVLPGDSTSDVGNRHLRYAEQFADLTLGHPASAQFANPANIALSEMTAIAGNTTGNGSMPNLVALVVGLRAPVEIVGSVVLRIAVQVATLQSVRTTPRECLQYKARHKPMALPSFVADGNLKVAVRCRARFQPMPLTLPASPGYGTPDRPVRTSKIFGCVGDHPVLNRFI